MSQDDKPLRLIDERVARIAGAYFGDPRHVQFCIAAIGKALREAHLLVETPSAERATVPEKIRGYAEHFQVHRHHAVAEMAEFILKLTEPVAPNSSDRSRIDAALRACDGLSTLDLSANKRGWLAELCYDAHKLDEPYKAGAQKCLEIVKEMRAAIVHEDSVDYGILSRIEYRLQKVVDKPVAPAPAK